ncbi:GFA family protein [Erythrobacter sp. MTPC3]|uniref:GFA family protein n=1 Tax=Erythrobacter sp. MTPC3 TaxID=3056564 RepID=UPI0036F198C8
MRYSISARELASYACHCRECQKQSASAFGISVPVAASDFSVTGELGSWERLADSGAVTRCHFCLRCGSRVYHDGASRPGMVTIKGGSLDCAGDLQPAAHIWTCSKQDWVVLPQGVPQWDRQPASPDQWKEILR